ncbi:hypothetical protein [Streptomyces dysideae]|uniref:Uncharacterized protein n=1 Tax=Streptomyces dysideae TaxID=909626 RepID=A0A101V362_9ACTN|nr:hypothetical protein [Streptomyces dysideae]KUO21669.1 hypothetical protein AQJ91_07785 [Streptomyces dysideae]
MGERQSGGGMPGRRHVRPGGTASGHSAGARGVLDDAALEALLAAAIRVEGVDAEGERRAVAAFRAAREAGVHQARARRRDDWRPREQRGLARSVKATLSLFVASLALGGVAVAAIGSAGSSSDDGDDKVRPTAPATSAPEQPAAPSSGEPSGSGPSDRPDAAQDTEAQCRAYEQVKERGNALDAAAWQRLVTAAGGEEKVAPFCADQLAGAQATSRPTPSTPARPTPTPGAGNATNGAGNADSGGSGQAGETDNGVGRKN